YHSLGAGGATLHRVDPWPAFYLGDSSPHPRIPTGSFEVVWSGVLQVHDAGPLAFGALAGGELKVEVDGTTVVDGRGRAATSRLGPPDTLTRAPGHYGVTVRYRSVDSIPARLQLFWEGPGFAREPLPAWRFTHQVTGESPALLRDENAARGREAAG